MIAASACGRFSRQSPSGDFYRSVTFFRRVSDLLLGEPVFHLAPVLDNFQFRPAIIDAFAARAPDFSVVFVQGMGLVGELANDPIGRISGAFADDSEKFDHIRI
jgi:hypothetical protein